MFRTRRPIPTTAQNLQPLGVAGQAAHLALATGDAKDGKAPTSVSLFDQGLIQVLQASVTGLEPKQKYVLALADRADGRRPVATAGCLHDQSGRIGHRQRRRPDPADRRRGRNARSGAIWSLPPAMRRRFGEAVQMQDPVTVARRQAGRRSAR